MSGPGERFSGVVCLALMASACAASEKTGFSGGSSGDLAGPGGGDDAMSNVPPTPSPDALAGIGTQPTAPSSGLESGAPRTPKCDADGHCTCLNIASIGMPGITGFQAGMGGMDNTSAFTNWLNTQSSAAVDLIVAKPAITTAFLAKYDVLIIQWLVNGVSPTNKYDGMGYWTFSTDELNALKTWVSQGGGLITLSGYDASNQEVGPLNQLIQAVSDISYGPDDVLGMTGVYCLGESNPLIGWNQSTPIGQHIMEVGAFHGRPIHPGTATVDCSDATYVYAAHETVGLGHVFAYTDEWVTYTSQWTGAGPQGCGTMSAAANYQVPQFWYNAISWAGSAAQCTFTINSPTIIR